MMIIPKSCHTKLTYQHIKVICGKSLITLSIETTLLSLKITLLLTSFYYKEMYAQLANLVLCG